MSRFTRQHEACMLPGTLHLVKKNLTLGSLCGQFCSKNYRLVECSLADVCKVNSLMPFLLLARIVLFFSDHFIAHSYHFVIMTNLLYFEWDCHTTGLIRLNVPR